MIKKIILILIISILVIILFGIFFRASIIDSSEMANLQIELRINLIDYYERKGRYPDSISDVISTETSELLKKNLNRFEFESDAQKVEVSWRTLLGRSHYFRMHRGELLEDSLYFMPEEP